MSTGEITGAQVLGAIKAGVRKVKQKVQGGSGGNDSKFFTTTKKGEIHELRSALRSPNFNQQKDAVKKVIAAMTVGKDVSSLFTDVLNCMQTENIELKKLVYLYIMNNAKSNPELAILAVNTFKKDTRHENALVRALAVRTMGCIRVESVTEYLCEALQKCLTDHNPYVRKTAAICVAKLYDISPDLVEVQGFIDALLELISDPNPTVVANAVAALADIKESSGEEVLDVDTAVLQKLLAALNECTEWGQVFILDSLAEYTPQDESEAESIIERVVPRLKHANSAVVLSAVKVIMQYMEVIPSADAIRALCRKMAPPLVSLLCGVGEFPEIQYVALRNINLIVQKRPSMLTGDIKVFFCKYDDPIYVKMEKLEIIIKLVSDRNVEQVLMEFKEYAREVDVEFVRKSVRAIGRCAIKLARSAERCINVLLDLVQTHKQVDYVVQEAIIVIKDVFRKYPNDYEQIIGTLCENLTKLVEPEAKSAMIWIIGEYAERIDNADELLEYFLDSFDDEPTSVQLQLLTAVVKLYLKKPDDESGHEMVTLVLNKATENSDDPDLRDRGYVYWRLLVADPDAARAVVLAERPVISDDTSAIEASTLDMLISNLSTLAAIYHKPPEAFVKDVSARRAVVDDDDDDMMTDSSDDGDEDDMMSGGASGAAAPAAAAAPAGDLLGDLLSDLGGSSAPAPASASAGGAFPADLALGPLVSPKAGSGCGLKGAMMLNADLAIALEVHNRTGAAFTTFMIKVNKNCYGLRSADSTVHAAVAAGGVGRVVVPLVFDAAMVNASSSPKLLQVAMKNSANGSVMKFTIPFPGLKPLLASLNNHAFAADGALEKGAFLEMWQSFDDAMESSVAVSCAYGVDTINAVLGAKNIFFIAKRRLNKKTADEKSCCYFALKVKGGSAILIELTFAADGSVTLCTKTEQQDLVQVVQKCIKLLVSQ
jgi:AP-1 complex subunit beta-1